ncbi:MAG: formylmethanofuran--tetrahydromethanopterin N-formyltransferase [Candidatus Hermodarchaeota archaeon]
MSETKIDSEGFAEGFSMRYCRALITASTQELADIAAQTTVGFGTSIIGCPSEAGIEKPIPKETPDGRPGRIIQIYHSKKKKLEANLLDRFANCILTAPTTALFNLTPIDDKSADIGAKLSYFGDKHQQKGELNGRTIYRVPVMDGEFIIEKDFGIQKGVAGGNLIILGKDPDKTLIAAQDSVKAALIKGIVAPFPGGICRSGSKVGSHYKFLFASTNHRYCPTLKDKVDDSLLSKDVNCVYELVINGVDFETVHKALVLAAKAVAAHDTIVKVTAANYGGKLGKHKIPIF